MIEFGSTTKACVYTADIKKEGKGSISEIYLFDLDIELLISY